MRVIKSLDKINPFLEVLKGIEKEALRINQNAEIAKTKHPIKLGSALTHPEITTDFSEALLEFVTPVYQKTPDLLKKLQDLHTFTNEIMHIDQEKIWPSSMPPILPVDNEIPIAQYGKSNIGKLKTTYRRGLGYRYGRSMQTIAGIHYNFSISDKLLNHLYEKKLSKLSRKDFSNELYLGLIRNFLRNEWLLIYLFGANPSADESFIHEKEHSLLKLNKRSYYLPYATSLRMGGLGYTSNAQDKINICYNSLGNYIKTLQESLTVPFLKYKEIPSLKNGEYQQINPNLLQIENEFYSTIRPKRVTKTSERPLEALEERGIEYIEVRLLDINPYLSLGIDEQQINFLDSFLLYCLLNDSPEMSELECLNIKKNRKLVVEKGRMPNLSLLKNEESCSMKEMATQILSEIKKLTLIYKSNLHTEAVAIQEEKIKNPKLTPSGKLLEDLIHQKKDYLNFILEKSKELQSELLNNKLSTTEQDYFQKLSISTLKDQKEIEDQDIIDFDQYLLSYNL